jgi:hypothetical protein
MEACNSIHIAVEVRSTIFIVYHIKQPNYNIRECRLLYEEKSWIKHPA